MLIWKGKKFNGQEPFKGEISLYNRTFFLFVKLLVLASIYKNFSLQMPKISSGLYGGGGRSLGQKISSDASDDDWYNVNHMQKHLLLSDS